MADAFVSEGAPDANFGAEQMLEIDGSPRKEAYLRFDLAGLAGATLRSASLRLRVADIGGAESSSSQTVHLTDGRAWEEETLVFSARPLAAGEGLGTLPGGSRDRWTEAELGATLQARLGFSVTLLVSSTGSDGLDVYAREGSHPPELVLAYDLAATPTPTSTPTSTPTPSSTPTATATGTPTPPSTRPPPDPGVFLPKVNR